MVQTSYAGSTTAASGSAQGSWCTFSGTRVVVPGFGLKKYVRTITWYHLSALMLSFLALPLSPSEVGSWGWFLCLAGGWLQAERVNPDAVPTLVLVRTVKSTPEPNFGEPPALPHFYAQVNLRDPCCLNSILPGEENEWAH